MKNNFLNEELNQMKYLFGYKPGRVISEQAVNQTVTVPKPQNNTTELLAQLLEVAKTGDGRKILYFATPLAPGILFSSIFAQQEELGLPGDTKKYDQVNLSYREFKPAGLGSKLYPYVQKFWELTPVPPNKLNLEDLAGQLRRGEITAVKPLDAASLEKVIPGGGSSLMELAGELTNYFVDDVTPLVEFLEKNFGNEVVKSLYDQLDKVVGDNATFSIKDSLPTRENARKAWLKIKSMLNQGQSQSQPTTQSNMQPK